MSEIVGGPAYVPGQQPYPGYPGGGQRQVSPGSWWGGYNPMPWGTQPGQQPYPSWEDFYGEAPGGAPEVQAWMNSMLPWYQQAQNQQQFQQQMEYQRWLQGSQQGWEKQRFGKELTWARDQQRIGLDWEREQQQEQIGYQRWATSGGWEQEKAQQDAQLAYNRWLAGGTWGQETGMQERELESRAQLQTQELAVQQEIEGRRAEAQETQATWSAFGRRYQPNARWLR